MIPGISIIVFLKCKDSGIRDFFCFSDLLCLWLRAHGGCWRSTGWVVGPGDTTGAPNANEARFSLMEQIQEKQYSDEMPGGWPKNESERKRTLVVRVFFVRDRKPQIERRNKKRISSYILSFELNFNPYLPSNAYLVSRTKYKKPQIYFVVKVNKLFKADFLHPTGWYKYLLSFSCKWHQLVIINVYSVR